MARATRSSANVEQVNKKRKRNSSPHEKSQKLIRTSEQRSGSVADLTLSDVDARKILDVLETSDSLGLLDRVFPLSPSSDITFSFRTLLSQPGLHSLRVLRAAIQHLYPLSSHPRSKPSETASQQLHFCNLALSLLDQASHNLLSVPLDTTSLLSPDPSDSPADESKSPTSPPSPSLAKRRYALVQHLPSGDYWSSLSSESTTSPTRQFKDLPTGHAELVSILPTSSSTHTSKSPPSLGSYCAAKPYSKKALPAQRRVTTGTFLDYGPWTSFAPSFDHDGEIAGCHELGHVLWYKHERKAHRETELREWIEGRRSVVQVPDKQSKDKVVQGSIDIEAEFDGILPPEDIRNLKAALDNAELERLVDELLARNQRALVRLQELQIERLTKGGVDSTIIDETSEEWEIAHGIMKSLETLTLLRPRAASGEVVSITPPISILRKLHKTIALEPLTGWHGTLAPTRTTALRDDSTVKVKPSSTVPTAVSTSSSPAPSSITPVASTSTPTTTPYAGYAYAYSTQQQAQPAYRPAATAVGATTYAQYKPGAYYQNYTPGTQQQQQQQYYGQQAYGAGATSQQPYAAYSSWFAHAQYSQVSAAAAGTTSTGRGTPQPAAAYGNPYTQQAQQQQRPVGAGGATTPAVANTVAANKVGTATGAATGAWVGYAGQQQNVVPTLPAHLRTTQVVANGYQPQQQQSYYGAYPVPQQPQQSAAR